MIGKFDNLKRKKTKSEIKTNQSSTISISYDHFKTYMSFKSRWLSQAKTSFQQNGNPDAKYDRIRTHHEQKWYISISQLWRICFENKKNNVTTWIINRALVSLRELKKELRKSLLTTWQYIDISCWEKYLS